MIVFCSARSLTLIKEALAQEIGKDRFFPAIVDSKEDIKRVRAWCDEHPERVPYLWNLDMDSLPLHAGKPALTNTYRTAYLYNAAMRSIVIAQGLAPQDFLDLDKTFGSFIRGMWGELSIVPEAIDLHLKRCFETMYQMRKDLKLGYEALDGSADSSVILVPNGNRKATSALNMAREHLACLQADRILDRTNELVDYHDSWVIASYLVSDKTAKGGYVIPLEVTHAKTQSEVAGLMVPTLTLHATLLDEYTGKPWRDGAFFRDIAVPATASLFWLHHALQRTMRWYDYHLHDFQLLDRTAQSALEDAFWAFFPELPLGIDRIKEWGGNPERFYEGGAAAFEKTCHLSPRWLYHDFLGLFDDPDPDLIDCPNATLPEQTMLGCYFMGDETMRKLAKAKSCSPEDLSTIELSGPGLVYHYDYGDGWALALTASNLRLEDASKLPCIVNAQGETPPEDVGGLGGYEKFLDALASGNMITSDGVNLGKWAQGNGWVPFKDAESLKDIFCTSRPTCGR